MVKAELHSLLLDWSTIYHLLPFSVDFVICFIIVCTNISKHKYQLYAINTSLLVYNILVRFSTRKVNFLYLIQYLRLIMTRN